MKCCLLHRLVLLREELDNPHKPKTYHAFGDHFSVIINFEAAEDAEK